MDKTSYGLLQIKVLLLSQVNTVVWKYVFRYPTYISSLQSSSLD